MIYLDHHAATPLSDAVRAAMADAHAHAWANPSSVHGAGRAAKRLLERARAQVAGSVDAQPADLVFAAGGTEAANLALLGIARASLRGGQGSASPRRIVTTAIEHPAVSAACSALEREGFVVDTLAVPAGVPPSASELAQRLGPDVAIVAIQWVNHETGTLVPVHAYAEVCRERAVPLVVDACQALGKVPVSIRELGASAVVLSAAKIGGPAGVAALWLERCRELEPLVHGGSQERGRRPGTPDVAAAVGFGVACAETGERLRDMPRLAALRDKLEQACVRLGAVVNGASGPRVATACNVSFRDWRSDMLVPALDLEGLCVSAGAACSSGVSEPSPVLRAMYPDEPWRAESALRLSLGVETTAADVDGAVAVLERVLPRARRA